MKKSTKNTIGYLCTNGGIVVGVCIAGIIVKNVDNGFVAIICLIAGLGLGAWLGNMLGDSIINTDKAFYPAATNTNNEEIFRKPNEAQTKETNPDEMVNKYSLLIKYFTICHALEITKVTKYSVNISSSTMNIWLDFVGGNTEVFLKTFFPSGGNISKKWNFSAAFPEKNMINEIDNFFKMNFNYARNENA